MSKELEDTNPTELSIAHMLGSDKLNCSAGKSCPDFRGLLLPL